MAKKKGTKTNINYLKILKVNEYFYYMADNVGFEPTVGCPTLSFQDSGLNRSPNCL